MFEIRYARSVRKDIERITSKNRRRIKEAIEDLKNFPNVSNIKQLANHPIADYRLRVGNYRVLFDVNWQDQVIYILKIGHRRDIY